MFEEEGIPETPEESMIEEATKPYIEDVMKYALKYGVEKASLFDTIRVIRKAIENGDYDIAIHMLEILMGNAKSPPIYVGAYPVHSKVVAVFQVVPDELEAIVGRIYGMDKVKIRPDAMTYAHVIFYRSSLDGKVYVTCWLNHWLSVHNSWFTEPCDVVLANKIMEYIIEKEGITSKQGTGEPEPQAHSETQQEQRNIE